MQEPTPKTTFVGPVVTTGKSVSGPSYFILLQDGGALKLEYPTIGLAKRARNDLLQLHDTHAVNDARLFDAIHRALVQASMRERGEVSHEHG